jgi:hypothetical protein
VDVTVRDDEQGIVLALAGELEDSVVGVVRAAAEVARGEHRRLLVDVSDASGLTVPTLELLAEIAGGAGGRVLIRA